MRPRCQARLFLYAVALVGLMLVLTPTAGATRGSSLRGWTFTASVRTSLRHHPRRAAHYLRVRRDRAHTAIVGGTQISIERAPWQVALLGEIPVEIDGKKDVLEELCGGAILSETRVLTAAHCMFDPETGEQAPAKDFHVAAGRSDLDYDDSTEQLAEVTSVRVHPYFSYAAGPGSPDDVAILKLAPPLSLAGPGVRSVAVVAADSTQLAGAQVELTGFGEQNPDTEELNGGLYSLGMTLGSSERCGGEADAVFLCASAPAGSACSGDSGGGLTSAGSTPTLIGILSTIEVVSGQACGDDSDNGFTNLAAPEISDFIENAAALPPKAPRGGAGVKLTSPSRALWVGESLTCSPGSWSGEPTFTYTFIDSAGGQVLQSGSSPEYQLTTADIGRTILCELQAANAGGTAVERTAALAAVEAGDLGAGEEAAARRQAAREAEQKAQEAADKPPAAAPLPMGEWCGEGNVPCAGGEPALGSVSLAGSDLTVQSDGVVLVKLDCKGDTGCSGKLTLSVKATSRAKGREKVSRTITIGTAKFSIAAGKRATVKIELDATGRGLLGADRERLSAGLTILKTSPSPSNTHTENVQLAQERAHGKTGKGPLT